MSSSPVRWLALLVVAMLIVAGVVQTRQRSAPPLVRHSTIALDTFVTVQAPARSDKDAAPLRAAMVESVSAMIAVGDALNFYDAESELSRANRSAEPFLASATLARALTTSMTTARETGGALDPSLGFLSRYIWRWDQENLRVPDPLHIMYARPFVGWQGIQVISTPAGVEIVRATPRLTIDLGAIGKGSALLAGAAALRRAGVESFLINAGGDLVAGARPERHRPWRVGIQHPRRRPGIYFTTVAIENEALATSGDYERYALLEGLRYHHIIDPKTLYPSTASLSATVIAPEPDIADVLATAAFVLGESAPAVLPRVGAALGCRPEAISVLVVLPSGRVVASDDGRWADAPARLTLLAPEDSLDP